MVAVDHLIAEWKLERASAARTEQFLIAGVQKEAADGGG
jgi:hypothetical protein